MDWNVITALIGLGLTQLAQVIGLVWYLSGKLARIESTSSSNGVDIAKVDAKLEKHAEAFDEHIQDVTVHTTQEQRKDLQRSIEKLSERMDSGYNNLSNKLDQWAARILSK